MAKSSPKIKKTKGIMAKPSPKIKKTKDTKKKKTKGVTSLLRFISKLRDGEKYSISFNPDTFEPIGRYAAKFKNYVSYVARSKVNINEEKWKKISDNLKNKIWEDITGKFTCPPDDEDNKEFKKHWFVYMGARMKQFKTLLTNVYIHGEGDTDGNTTPFQKYTFIQPEDWDLFVKTRTTEEFQEKRRKGKLHAAKNVHPHNLSRGGYERLREKIMEERMKKAIEEANGDESLIVDPPELERYEAWLMARQKPSGDFTSEATNSVAAIVGDLVEKCTQGDIVFEEREDILTIALGTKERPGQIRTAPRGVGIKKFYGKASHSILRGITLADIEAFVKKMDVKFEHRLQEELKQQRIESYQQVNSEMEDKRAEILKEIKLLQDMQLELRPKSIKEIFSKEAVREKVRDREESAENSGQTECKNVQNVGTRSQGSCSIEDYVQKIRDLKEAASCSLYVTHEEIELSIFIDERDLNELCSGVKWISTSVLSLWCSYLHDICVSKNVKELFGFLDPNRTLCDTRQPVDITSYIQDKLKVGSKKCYLGPLLFKHHWQLVVICPEDNEFFWFCSLHKRPKKYIKDIFEKAVNGYHLSKGGVDKKPKWKIVKGHEQNNAYACGYYVMKAMHDIVDASIVERYDEVFCDTSPHGTDAIDHVRQLWAQYFLKMFENRVEEHPLPDQSEDDKDVQILSKRKRKKRNYI